MSTEPGTSAGRASTRALVAFVALIAALGVLAYTWTRARDVDARAVEAPSRSAAPAVEDAQLARGEPDARRETPAAASAPAAAASPAAPTPVPAAAAPRLVRGRVLNTEGAPLAGIDVVTDARRDARAATSASDGSFELELGAHDTRLYVSSLDWVTLHCGVYRVSDPARELLVVAANAIALAGRVVDTDGRTLEHAHVVLELAFDALSAFPLPLHTTDPVDYAAETDANGAFAFAAAPSLARLELVTRADGYAEDRRAAPRATTLDLEIALRARASGADEIRGVVVHADGSPALEASVHLGDDRATVDERGAFRLALPKYVAPELPLVAAKRGYQAAVLPDYSAVIARAERHPSPVRLELGAEALEIRGTIVDASGAPQAGWNIALADPTALSASAVPIPSAERETLGKRPQTLTKADGAFVLGGLRARDYTLQAYHTKTLANLRSGPIAAGTQDVLLRVPADALVDAIRGRVVARDGRALERVHVTVQFTNERSKYGATMQTGSSTQTSSDGAWSLANVPRSGAFLLVGSDETIPLSYDLAGVDLEQPIVITPLRRCHFRVENGPREPAPITFQVLDARDQVLDLMQIEGRGWSSFDRGSLSDGTCRALAVSEDATALHVFGKGGALLATRALALVPGEVTVVRL